MAKVKSTREIIAEMLRENTGWHFLDSGDYYGRHWEANQGRQFENEPEAWIEIWDGQPLVTLNVYWFLVRALEYDPAMDQAFHEFAQLPENRELPWLEVMEAFPAWITDNPTGPYGSGKPMTVNTYNGEDLLSQVIQYVYFEIDNQGYVILQIHNGCDVRGGYTKPHVFRCDIDDYPSIFDNCRAAIWCENGHGWTTDDGYHWYPWKDDYRHLEDYQLEEPKEGEKPKCPICGAPLEAGL